MESILQGQQARGSEDFLVNNYFGSFNAVNIIILIIFNPARGRLPGDDGLWSVLVSYRLLVQSWVTLVAIGHPIPTKSCSSMSIDPVGSNY
ncbi:uncharacterized protein BO95DRAFT_115769 [Aspergillus brunneoviolaceus CBS 621.78]|uniref:Uncharacterized protein n=1 Tax=Aspergillus brunneoviolaceus CBS 621.78 TaxID=1450534 RepID=A0ACD1GNV5_9EURO|nr:hypothetical protein BO95DRAFT_115769 [Aspergillus brunneoviolaceus CBS 621.78]RAH50860.1 hypothetical protein BO95DRAFT_115769 [Aspergillus brunneoviolaceus CBS 621.78]